MICFENIVKVIISIKMKKESLACLSSAAETRREPSLLNAQDCNKKHVTFEELRNYRSIKLPGHLIFYDVTYFGTVS